MAAGLGLGLGLALRCDEGAFPRLNPASTSATAPLRVISLTGRLDADSSRTKGGFTLYSVSVLEVGLEGAGLRGRASAAGRLKLLVPSGPSLEAGMSFSAGRIRYPGGKEGPGPGSIAFADRPSFSASPPQGFLGKPRSILRSALHGALDRAGGGGASSGLLVALLEGSRDELDAEEGEAFKRAGCAAILSLSGQHLSILAAALALCLGPLVGPYKAKAASLGLIGAFVYVAGFQPALLRSVIMYALGAIALFCDRPQEGRCILGLSFALQLFLDPASARELSFCLSYLALAGLVVVAPRCEHLVAPFLPPILAKAVAASFAAQVATLPLAAAAFGCAYPIGFVASIASAPLVAAFIWWGLLGALLCGPFPALASLVGPVSRLLHGSLAGMMEAFATCPPLPLGGPSLWLAGGGVVLAAAFVYAWPHAEHAHGLRLLASRRIHPRAGSLPSPARAHAPPRL
jgi:ComEC/Rec2-related protein